MKFGLKQHKLLFGIIIILVVAIGCVNFSKYKNFIFNNNNQQTDGQVKGVTNVNISDFQITKVPQRSENFKQPKIWADSYVLIDQHTFYPLAEEKMNEQVPIASTTKIMTAIIVLENYKLDDVVEVSKNAATQIGSDVFLRIGEKITVKDLLYCLLIKSGNDSAMALAEHLTGNYKDFVLKMNKKAKYLGLENTNFQDPAGLDDTGYSTPHDLAVMASYALKNETFQQIVATPEITITTVDGIPHKLENSNRLVKGDEILYYPDAIGVKTGFTPDAGHCLIAAAEQNDHTLISVILKTFEDTKDASAKESKKLLEWGFGNYEWQ